MHAPKHSFTEGLRDGLPIFLGYVSVAFAFGISATGQGLTVWQVVLISMTNVTSAGQLAGVPLIAASAPLTEIGLTQLIINLRYALMSVSLSQKLDPDVRLGDRFAISFVNTDEVFAVASGKEGKVGRAYLYGLILPPYVGWAVGTLVGAVAGNILPAFLISALGIAIYGMFIAIIVPPLPDKPRRSGGCADCRRAQLSDLLHAPAHFQRLFHHSLHRCDQCDPGSDQAIAGGG